MLYNFPSLHSPLYILDKKGLYCLMFNLHEDSTLLDYLFNQNRQQASSLISVKGIPFTLCDNYYLHDDDKIHSYNNINYKTVQKIQYGQLRSHNIPLKIDDLDEYDKGLLVNGRGAHITDINSDTPLCKFTFTKTKLNNLFNNNYLDYSKYSNYILYLPCIGYRDIDYSYLINSNSIVIEYYFDYYTTTIVCNVICNIEDKQIVIMQEYNNVGYDIPITYNDGTEFISNSLKLGANILDLGLAIKGIPTGTSSSFSDMTTTKYHTINKRKLNKDTGRLKTIADTKNEYTKSVSGNREYSSYATPEYQIDNVIYGIANLFNSQVDLGIRGNYNQYTSSNYWIGKPVILYSHPSTYSDNLNNLLGRPLYKVRQLNTLRGFTVVNSIHLNIPCLSDELNEIEQLLKSGVILNTNVPIPDVPPVTPTPEPETPATPEPEKPTPTPDLPEGEAAKMLCCFNGKFRVTGIRGTPAETGRTRNHYGLDLVGMDSTNVYAISSGWVKITNTGSSGLGKCVHVQMDDPKYYGQWILYGHLSSFAVANKQYVEKGQLLGVMGDTGESRGYHTHLEWRNKYDQWDSDFSKYNICEFTGIPNISTPGQNVFIGSPIYKTTNGESVQKKLGLENQTIQYLENYTYAEDLMRKIDEHTK